jgi:hypothetical protein
MLFSIFYAFSALLDMFLMESSECSFSFSCSIIIKFSFYAFDSLSSSSKSLMSLLKLYNVVENSLMKVSIKGLNVGLSDFDSEGSYLGNGDK